MDNEKDDISYLTQKELKKLFDSIERSKDSNKHWLRDICIFRTAYRCALRASEVGLILASSYNKQRGEIYCRRLKGSQNNTIRIDDQTKSLLNKYIREYSIVEEGILFKSQENKPISRQMLDRLMKKYCVAARITDTNKQHFHILKHSIAVHLAESGLDIKELQHYLGHKNVNNTLIYFQFTTIQQEAMYQKLQTNNRLV